MTGIRWPMERMSELAHQFDLLSSTTRIEILTQLTDPVPVSAIRATADLSREGENPERALSRQAVTRHLDLLVRAGIVTRLATETSPRGDQYVVNHARLFAMVDDLRQIATLKPRVWDYEEETTMIDSPARDRRLPAGPRLVIAYGVEAGTPFPLAGPPGTVWQVGRARDSHVRLDHDPFVSVEHARVSREADGSFTIMDGGSRNRTRVNWEPLEAKVPVPLVTGDLVNVGRTLLVFQP